MNDPLGYDTSEPGYLRRMARDALCGRHQAAVDAEADRIADALGRPRIQRTLRRRLKLWFSYRYWRVRFWLEDNLLQGRRRPFHLKDHVLQRDMDESDEEFEVRKKLFEPP